MGQRTLNQKYFKIPGWILLIVILALSTGVSLAQEGGGISDSFVPVDNSLLPGYDQFIHGAPSENSHQTQEPQNQEPENHTAETGNTTESDSQTGIVDKQDPSETKTNKSFFQDKTFLNIILLLVFVIVFIIYRFRTGKNRRSYL